MAYTPPLFSTDNRLGVDMTTAGYDQPYVLSTSTPEYPAIPFAVGTEATISQGGAAIYAQATAAAVAQGDVCIILTSPATATATGISPTFYAVGLTSTNAATNAAYSPLGVSLSALATGNYGWFQTQGNCPAVSLVNGLAAGALLYTTATAGRLGAIATGANYRVAGIFPLTTSAGTAGVYPGVILPTFALATAQ